MPGFIPFTVDDMTLRQVLRFLDLCGEPDENECWPWLGSMTDTYGQFSMKQIGRIVAHRVSYVVFVGPIPEGLTLDHLCRHVWCVNPWHLEPVTMRENTLRGVSPVARNARRTHCTRGHEFTPENTQWIMSTYGPYRRCKRCESVAASIRWAEGRTWKQRRAQEAAAS